MAPGTMPAQCSAETPDNINKAAVGQQDGENKKDFNQPKEGEGRGEEGGGGCKYAFRGKRRTATTGIGASGST